MFDPLLSHLHAINTSRYDIALLRAVWREDRYEPAALLSLQRWTPEVLVASTRPLPECTCHAGRCSICN